MARSQSVGAGLTRGHVCGWREHKGDGIHRHQGKCESFLGFIRGHQGRPYCHSDNGLGRSGYGYINKALYFGDKMSHTLLCPNQLRAYGWKVQDVPKQFDAESAHAIIDPTGTFRMPLEMSGVISYLPTRKPTEKEDRDLRFVRSHLRRPLGALQSVLSRTGAADDCGGYF
jgi:hypothetical protein